MDLVDVPLGFSLGDKFKTADDFNDKLITACQDKYVQYYKRDSLTISAAAKKVKRHLNADLKYFKVQYCCIHGGRQFKTAGTGKRNKKTFRGVELCPSTITIRVSSTGEEFEIIAQNTFHNHKIDAVLFRHLPQQRQLPKELKEEAKRLLQLKGNKHLIRQRLEEASQKVVKLKDLDNLRQENRAQYRNNIESSVKKINEKFESDCHLLIDHENVFKGLMFCTPTMKNAMRAYPEILCLDATYKLLNIRAPVYLILIEDGDGESQVVAVGVLLSEDHDSLKWFLEAFKEMNPSWTNTKNIMADKDLNERQVLKMCFPQAQISICLFHVFKIFHREITSEKMKITSLERNKALELLQNITFSKSVEEFDKIKSEISNSLSQVVVDYLEQHWVDIRDEWCPFLGEKILNLMNRTNNRVENINAKLKAVISKNSTLEEFLDHLFVILKSLEKERQNRLAERINKRSIIPYKKESPQYSYFNYISEYAFQKVLNQLNNRTKVKVSSVDDDCFTIVRNTDEDDREKQKATQDSCDCYFYNSMGLPCKHIFCVRDILKLNLFEETLVNERWTKHYILQNQHFFTNLSDQALAINTMENATAPIHSIDVLPPTTNKVYSQQEKYKKAFSKCKLIATLCCEASGKNFENVMTALDDFILLLESNNHSIKVTPKSVTQLVDHTYFVSEPQEDAENQETETVSDVLKSPEIVPNTISVLEHEPLHPQVSTNEAVSQIEADAEVQETGTVGDMIIDGLFEHQDIHLEEGEEITSTEVNLSELKLPPILKKRGRPSGSDRTVIGLPSKRKRKCANIPFNKIKNTDRADILLKWIVKDETDVHRKRILDESDVKDLEEIDLRLTEVNLTVVKNFFTTDAFRQILRYKQLKRSSGIWVCNICGENINNDPSIRCDRCVHWMHISCTNPHLGSGSSQFFCGQCDI